MTRHTRLHLAVATVALATVLAACGARGGTSPQAGEEPPAEQNPSATYELEDTLVFAGAGAGLGEAWKAILDDFAAEHGVSYEYVEGSVGDNQSKVEAQIRSGTVEVDVVMSNENVAAIARAQGLTTDLDYDRLPNVEALGPMGQPGDFAGPVAAVSVLGIAYSPSYFAQQGWEPPTSWADVMDERYADCLIAPHPEGGGQRLTIALMNRTFGSGYEDIQATLDRFAAIVDRVPTATSHVTEGLDFVSQGIGCLTVGAQGRVLEAKAAGGDIEFVIPEEGTAAQGLPLYIVPTRRTPTSPTSSSTSPSASRPSATCSTRSGRRHCPVSPPTPAAPRPRSRCRTSSRSWASSSSRPPCSRAPTPGSAASTRCWRGRDAR